MSFLTNGPMQYLARLKFECRTLVAREPSLSILHEGIVWWNQYKMKGHIDIRECKVYPDTELVIDGFQGSGNSYLTVAFKYAQAETVKLAHHLHSPAQIIKAVRTDIPVIVTIRQPKNAVASLVSRWPNISLKQGLRAYGNFYRKIKPYADDCIISRFEMTTKYPDVVLDSLNAKYGTNFDVFEPLPNAVSEVRGNQAEPDRGENERQTQKLTVLSLLEHKSCASLLENARRIHDFILNKSV